MKRTTMLRCFAATTALCMSPFGETFAATTGPDIVSGPAAAEKLELRDLEVASDGSVTGSVANAAAVAIKDVELLVTHVWSWRDERHPGENNPGRSSALHVSGEIPAGGSVPFSYTPDPPLLKRTDGSFQSTVVVKSFTEIGN